MFLVLRVDVEGRRWTEEGRVGSRVEDLITKERAHGVNHRHYGVFDGTQMGWRWGSVWIVFAFAISRVI